jgi:hypothetical protein
MGAQAKSMDLELGSGSSDRLVGLLKAALAGSIYLPFLAGVFGLAKRTTPIVLRITQFGILAGLAITAWRGARHLGAWLTAVGNRPDHHH